MRMLPRKVARSSDPVVVPMEQDVSAPLMSAETTSILDVMSATVAEAVEQSVQRAMQPFAARLGALSTQVQIVTSLERKAKDRYVTFVGFNASCSYESREKAVREFLGKHCADSAHKVEHVGSDSKGAPRKPRHVCCVLCGIQLVTSSRYMLASNQGQEVSPRMQ